MTLHLFATSLLTAAVTVTMSSYQYLENARYSKIACKFYNRMLNEYFHRSITFSPGHSFFEERFLINGHLIFVLSLKAENLRLLLLNILLATFKETPSLMAREMVNFSKVYVYLPSY